MQSLTPHISQFLLGLRDAVSLYWVRKVLLVTHPTTKKIHPSSLKLLATFKNTLVQVFIFLIGLPYLFKYFNQDLIALVLSTLFLPLTYGYLFFYNTDVMALAKEIALWACKFPRTNFCQFDNKQNAQLFYSLSNQLKSFIFLILYYTPILLGCMFITVYFPWAGTLLLCISESFFNSIFYFMKKWPYDRFNIAFIERNAAYMFGYGFFVSFICNVCLSGDLSRGMYFIISQWMIINCLLHSPPDKKFTSLGELWECLSSSECRAALPNAYNIHRANLRKDKKYREQLLAGIYILKPALKITQYLNNILAKSISQGMGMQQSSSEQFRTESLSTKQTSSQSTTVSNSRSRTSTALDIVTETLQPEDLPEPAQKTQ